ncbi:HTTM domain-containing protein [Streptomyces spiramenti]|uniref:HTTM domain-containing protein n=1 Tax=Streptomyces spiramenti TaxID=2720606 RepID=UPI001ADD7F8B|nr:HTTM domain-containing protein [Streptomyces spiramenti]
MSPPPPPSERTADVPPPSPFADLGKKFDSALARGLGNITRRALGPHQTAVVRIGFAFTWLFYLVREFPHRHELYGPDSPWGFDLAEQMISGSGAFSVLMWSDGRLWFEFVYLMAVLAAVGLLLGWRTRVMSVLFMIGVLSLQNRSIFMGDGGDNVIKLMAMYLVLLRCGQVWSLDARRKARRAPEPGPDPTGIALWAVAGLALAVTTGGGLLDGWVWQLCLWGLWLVFGAWWVVERHWPGEPRLVFDVLANLVHNMGLLIVMAQVCLIYATAGWYKIQGTRWQDGTAVYYPMNLDYFTPFPELSQALTGNGILVMIMTYGTVFIQVAFPFALLNRKVKNVLLAVMIAEHIGIAVLMGLPFFSLAMIAMDIVFLPTAFLLWLGYRTRRATAPLSGFAGRRGRRGEPDPEGPEGVSPAQPTAGGTLPAAAVPRADTVTGSGAAPPGVTAASEPAHATTTTTTAGSAAGTTGPPAGLPAQSRTGDATAERADASDRPGPDT